MAIYSQSLVGGYGTLYLNINYTSQDVKNNTSTVSYSLYAKGRGNYGFWNLYHTGWTKVVIAGRTVHHETGRDFDLRGGRTQQLASGTTTVKHNDDGSKQFNFSAELWSSSAKGYISGTFTLPKIPRASSFTITNSDGTETNTVQVDQQVKININKAQSNYSHIVNYKVEDTEGTISSKTNNSIVNWTIPSNFYYGPLKNTAQSRLSISVTTYDGNTKLGESTQAVTVKVPDDLRPSIGTININENNESKIAVLGEQPFVQNISQINVQFSASGTMGSTIERYRIQLGQYSANSRDYTFSNTNFSGEVPVKVSATDSRGRTAEKTSLITVDAYQSPSVLHFSANRSNTNDRMASARIIAQHTVLGGFIDKNGMQINVYLSEKGASNWELKYSAKSNVKNFNEIVQLGADFDSAKAYDVKLVVKDSFNSHSAITVLPAGSMSLVLGADDSVIGVGKVPERKDGIDIKGGADFTDTIKVNGGQQTKAEFNGNSDNGAVIRLKVDDLTAGWIGSWGNSLQLTNRTNNRLILNSNFATYNNQPLGYSSGDNANGNWIKFNDGTALCWKTKIAADQFGVNSNSGVHYLYADWTYPVSFINENVFCSFEMPDDLRWATNNKLVIRTGAGQTTGRVYLLDENRALSSNSRVTQLIGFAIGRWK